MSTKKQPGGTAMLAGRPVARIGYGAMQLPGPGVLGPPRDRAAALALLRRAVELGVNHIDTAQYYGPDVANELIHAALHPYPEDLVLVTKVGAERDRQGRWISAQRPHELRAGVEANLRSLEVERIDVVNLRLAGDGAPGVDLDSQLAEMIALRAEGKIGGIGISSVSVGQLRQARPAGIACVQNAYNLLDRADEPLLELCKRERHRLGALLPPWIGLRGGSEGDRAPCSVGRRGGTGSHTRPGVPGLAPGARPSHPADPRHHEPEALERERGHR